MRREAAFSLIELLARCNCHQPCLPHLVLVPTGLVLAAGDRGSQRLEP